MFTICHSKLSEEKRQRENLTWSLKHRIGHYYKDGIMSCENSPKVDPMRYLLGNAKR